MTFYFAIRKFDRNLYYRSMQSLRDRDELFAILYRVVKSEHAVEVDRHALADRAEELGEVWLANFIRNNMTTDASKNWYRTKLRRSELKRKYKTNSSEG